MMQLFDYQEIGADFLAGRRRALLFDAPGIGKTAQAIRAADRCGAVSLGTVCPAAVVTQWKHNHKSIAESGNDFDSHSYEYARDKYIGRPKALTLDEVHYLGNPESKRTIAILGTEPGGADGIIGDAEYAWALSGTPAPANPNRLFPIMNAFVPESLKRLSGGTMDYWSFINKYCDFYDGKYGRVFKGGKNLDELRDRLAPHMLRRTKKDVLKDWKEPVLGDLWLDPGNARDLLMQAELSEEGQLIAKAFAEGGFEGLAVFAETERTGISRLRRYTGVLKVLPMVEWLLTQFDDGLNKIVLICIHIEVMQGIADKLTEHGIESVIYRGGMTDNQREKAKADFIKNPKKRVFLGQLFAFGTGTDGIQHATGRICFVEWSWIWDDNYQAVCRLDRIGQEENVLGQFAGFEGSLDGAIMAAACRRAADNETLFQPTTINHKPLGDSMPIDINLNVTINSPILTELLRAAGVQVQPKGNAAAPSTKAAAATDEKPSAAAAAAPAKGKAKAAAKAEPAAEEDEEIEVSEEGCKEILRRIAASDGQDGKAGGIDKVVALLKKHKVAKATLLKEPQYEAFIEDGKKVLAEATGAEEAAPANVKELF